MYNLILKQETGNMFFDHYIKPAEKKKENSERKEIKKFLQSIYFQVFITVVALYSLFSDDIRMAGFDASADLAFDVVHMILILIFGVEIILNWVAIEDYPFSFYFFLDLISSLSILLDISMITELMYTNK